MSDFRVGFKEYTRVLFRSLPLLWTAAPKEMLVLVAVTLLQGILPAISVWITKLVVDTVATALTSGKELGNAMLLPLVAAWVAALLLQTLLYPWIFALQGNLNDKLTAHISLLLMHKADSFPDLSRFEDSQFYDELQLLQEQINYKPLNLLNNLVELGRSLVTLIVIVGLLAPLAFWIPLVIGIATIPQIVVSSQYGRAIWLTLFENSPHARRMQYYTSVMLTDTYAKEIRLFKLGSFFMERYLQAFESLHQSMRYLRGKQAFWSSNLAILSTLGNGFAFYWVVNKAFKGDFTPGSVLLFVQSLTYFQNNLEGFVGNWLDLFENVLYMEKFFNFLHSPIPMPLSIPGEKIPTPIRSGITFEKVDFYYPDGRLALKDISFTLYSGQTVAIVGENGAGKTTLVKLLTRLYDPTIGRILVDGIDLKNFNLEQWRQQIAGVFQDFGHYALTLGENIALGNLAALESPDILKYAVEKADIAKLVEHFPAKEDTPLGKQFGGTELSGGQWQKLALARAFVRQQAQLLLLDEPTAALDPRSEYDLYLRFMELAEGKTTILITHRLASVRMAHRILVLKAGCLIEDGTHQELLQHGGEYTTLWNMQAQHYGISDPQ
ncbi:ABC transporter [Nostoc linckia z18]|uniref:ABC transporter n=2 Tax=Nostoc linckia TaxID=92942 RepID=A0A9Q5Z6K2_NOSLI|nr:ABC transporter ATP-binding protein [Nostoc linckia]PHK32807.1 ABC transporter [Nostoc linckia z15]PHK44196.1 ABC transporter [Nostoc linckia z16]PHJ69262.1 ABC transporter [Nostoc linckia z1]PHJ73413.1 ABC transporter [Nostoc linckia z3]PHJ78760.1 ABC transporter [Nostoc linckia z2]